MRNLEKNGFPPRVGDDATDLGSTKYSQQSDPICCLWIELNGTHFKPLLEGWLVPHQATFALATTARSFLSAAWRFRQPR